MSSKEKVTVDVFYFGKAERGGSNDSWSESESEKLKNDNVECKNDVIRDNKGWLQVRDRLGLGIL